MIKKSITFGAIAVLLLVASLWVVNKLNERILENILPQSVTRLKEDETEKIIVDKGRLVIVTKDGIRQPVHIPPSGRVVATRKKDGSTEFTVKNKGFSLEVGGGLLYSDTVRAGLDLRLAYWNRFGLHVGLAGGKAKPALVGVLAGSYRLDLIGLQNTSVYVGVTTLKMPGIGFRVEF